MDKEKVFQISVVSAIIACFIGIIKLTTRTKKESNSNKHFLQNTKAKASNVNRDNVNNLKEGVPSSNNADNLADERNQNSGAITVSAKLLSEFRDLCTEIGYLVLDFDHVWRMLNEERLEIRVKSLNKRIADIKTDADKILHSQDDNYNDVFTVDEFDDEECLRVIDELKKEFTTLIYLKTLASKSHATDIAIDKLLMVLQNKVITDIELSELSSYSKVRDNPALALDSDLHELFNELVMTYL